MCGICGAISSNPPGDLLARVSCMNDALLHRGPDSQGSFLHERGCIAVRRLAIIDLESGDQPIANEDGSLRIVFNGEIYNYVELTDQLQRRGHTFRTRSDTETIVHAYEEFGPSAVDSLHGMFAFAIYNTRDGSLFAARDRFGEKPLFYHRHGNMLVFSSEIRSLLEWPEVPRRVDLEALGYYLRVGFVPSPLTLFQDIFELPPASWLLWRNGQLEVKQYYCPEYQPSPELEDEDAAVEAVREALERAVRRQMRSDVPLGAFLSGGIDSSTVVALLQSLSSRPVKTYTIQMEDARHDESPVASAVAKHLSTDHHSILVRNADFRPDDVLTMVDHIGSPCIDDAAIPAFLLSKAAREEVTVCLTGDGGDEMFAGYPVFPWGLAIHRLGRLPRPLLRATDSALGRLQGIPIAPGASAVRRAKRALEAATQPGLSQFTVLNSVFLPEESRAMISDATVLSAACGDLPRLTQTPENADSWTTLRRLMYYRLKNNLPQIMLAKGDRMSMATSLELRAPLLDVDLASLAAKLPDKHLLKGRVGKHILRRVARPLLPDVVFSHPKTGFGVPLYLSRNDAYNQLSRELLSNSSAVVSLLNPAGVARIRSLALTRQGDQGDISLGRVSVQLFALVQLAAWGERFRVGL